MAPKIVCSLQDVVFSYPEANSSALDRVCLEVREGEWLALLGSNGSGKSTLAKHLNALLLPSQGACFVYGMDTRDETKLWDIRSHVAMVFQNPDNQIVGTVVEDDTAFGPENMGLLPEEIRRRVDWALSVTGLSHKAQNPTYSLSGGEKQRLAVAGALALDPPCLVLDEPTAMLDPQGRRDLLDILKNLHEQGRTIIYITHRLEETVFCDRAFVLKDGTVRWNGAITELFSLTQKLDEWGLETPPFVELWQMLVAEQLIPEGTPATVYGVQKALCQLL